jgi:hypothetical protein
MNAHRKHSMIAPTLIMGLFFGGAVAAGPAAAQTPAGAQGNGTFLPPAWTLAAAPSAPGFSLVLRPRSPFPVFPMALAASAVLDPPALPAAALAYPSPAASVSPRHYRGKPFLAAAEVAGLNLGVWAFLHYVGNAHYSFISWETIRENFRDGWEWDRSQYFVNFYHHPYHGYLYYNAGRANGLSYWGSALSALGGSLMWEMTMEKYRPSINDLITTTAGGIVYGEIGYRFSALVRKRGARGVERIWRETVGTLLDPVGGVNRLLNGRKDSDPGLPGSPDLGRILNGELFVTGPVVTRSGDAMGTKAAPIVGFTLHYGDPAGTGWSGNPFDVFSVDGRLRWGPDKPHMSLLINGALAGKQMAARNGGAHFLGLYQHYEYYGIDTLRVCGTSFTAGWTSRFELDHKVRLTAGGRLGWLGLGGSDDFQSDPVSPVPGEPVGRRSYNLATGITASVEANIAAGGYEYFSATWRHYRLFNLRVVGSRPGRESWNILQARASLPVWKTLGIGVAVEYCHRGYDLEGNPAGSRRVLESRVYAAWQF